MKRHLRLINRRCYIISLYSNVSYEDAVQDVLLEIALRLDMLDENMLWIINIVRRTLRRNKARKEILTYVADDWENIVVADTQKDYAEIFDEIAPYLEPDDRKMVQYLLEGYKIREIAEKIEPTKIQTEKQN